MSFFQKITILFSIAITALLLHSCQSGGRSHTEATQSGTTERNVPVNVPQYDENQTVESLKNDSVSTVQVIYSTEEFTQKVCEINTELGYKYKGKLPSIVDFYADWCGPCREISPYMVEFAKKYAGQIIIYKVNIDRHADIAQAFNVQSIPTLLFFHPDKQPSQTVGAMPQAELEKAIQELLLN